MQKKKSKSSKSLGEIQAKMKCQMEPSDGGVADKLECKDWPLLFKVYFIYIMTDCVCWWACVLTKLSLF